MYSLRHLPEINNNLLRKSGGKSGVYETQI